MSAHLLLNLLNELGKRDKMRGLPILLFLFATVFNRNETKLQLIFPKINYPVPRM